MEDIIKPTALSVQFENIPTELKRLPRWVMWKYLQVGENNEARFSKVPLTTHGKGASSTDPNTWTDYFSAKAAYETGSFDGVGVVFDGSDNLTGVDIDDCLSDGQLSEFAKNILDNVEGYCEISPSGTGVKLFTLANDVDKFVDHALGLEIYTKSRYFTVTGHKMQGVVPTELQTLAKYVPERIVKRSGDLFEDYKPPLAEWTIERVENELLPYLDPDGYSDWIMVGQCLHHQFGGDYEALELFDRWSERSTKYSIGVCQAKWNSFRGQGVTLRTMIFLVSQKNLQTAINNGDIVLEANSPVTNAKKFLEAEYSEEQGVQLVHYAGDFYIYIGTHYRFIEEGTIRSAMYRFLTSCKKMVKSNAVPFNPTQSSVNSILDAVKALVHLEHLPESRPPVWLKQFASNRPPAEKIVSMKNGLYHFDSDTLLSHSLGFFNTHSLPFEYDPTAACPQWEQFLNDVWGDDEEAKNLLMEYFGYVLSGDTKQQKYLSVIGPRRSGKGTINRILIALLGQNNVVSPQIEELCDTFALQSWLGKPLASFSDARLTGRNTTGVVSQMLRIVGGDPVTVNRKNKEALDVFLPTRIIMFSNEALQLSENSNALVGRMLMLQMTNSFYGKEDVGLYDKLSTELSGIFNMAMAANKRRLARLGERFVQPTSAQDTLDMASEIANPLSTFIDDMLEYDANGTIEKDDLFAVYKKWAMKQNLSVGTALSFKRRFISATQDKGVTSVRDRASKCKGYVYRGVKLNDSAQNYINSLGNFEKDGF